MAGKSASTSSPRINQLAVQTSALGLVMTRGWGRGRVKCNLIWFGAFRSIAHTEKSGGKGGGVKNTTYTYTASMILALCHGPIGGIRTVYRDKDVFTDGATTALAQAGLSVALGTVGQAPWPYLTSMFPDQALGYSETAYVYAQDYSLNDSAALQNHSFEVNFASQIAGLPDADPSIIVQETIESTPGWPAGMIGDLTVYGDYCLANGLVLSPVVEQQQTVSDFLSEIMQATNSEVLWSEGLVKVRTYGDETATGNGRTFTPDLTPEYDLTEDDFIPQGGEDGPPVVQEIVDQTDAYNIIQVEHLDRGNQYNTAIQTAQDLDNIIQYGARKKDPISLHSICETGIGVHAAQLILQRVLYRRERYKFQLPWNFVRLEPMDYVTLTTTTDHLLLNRRLVQIKEIDEDEDGLLTFTAEGVESGTASAARNSAHTGEGFSINTSVTPPSVSSPVILNATLSLTGGEAQVWIGAASPGAHWGGCEVWVSADGTNYKQVGVITDPARYGVSSTTLPAHADPDSTGTLGIDISTSGGRIETASQEDVDAGETLIYVGGELMAYRDAALTAPSEYDLTYLRRGLYGSTIEDHVTGEPFLRLDDAVFRYGYGELGVGSEIYVKLPSFNEFGLATESLADVTAHTLSLGPLPGQVLGLSVSAIDSSGNISLVWSPVPGRTFYTVYIYSEDGTTFKRTIDVTSEQYTYLQSDQASDGDEPAFRIFVTASNAAGEGSPGAITAGTGTGGGTGGGGAQPAALASTTATSARNNRLSMGCSVSGDSATTGYAFYASMTSGFTPADGDLMGTSAGTSLVAYVEAGYWYVRAAAFNSDWDGHAASLNFSSIDGPNTVLDYIDTCLDPETPVLLESGEGRLGDLVAGSRVRTIDPATERWGLHTVLAVSQHHAETRLRILLEDGRELVGTPRHRVRLESGDWSRLQDLERGVRLAGSKPGVVASSEPAGAGQVVSVTVSRAQTYVSAGILSHNIKA